MTPATRQRGETTRAYIERRSADFAAWQREQDAVRDAVATALARDKIAGMRSENLSCIPLSVGTYDANGQPKGANW